MNIVKQILQLSTKQKLQLSKEGVEYIASVIPPAVSHISPDMSPEVAAIFATAIKSTCFKIIDKALGFLEEGADIRDINVDWRANYFDKCRLVHNDKMQTLWAKILAGEANNRDTYSKHSVNVVANIDKTDADLFTDFCGYVCEAKIATDNVEKIEFVPLIFDDYLFPIRPGYTSNNPTYHVHIPDLHHLDSIGLIRFSEEADEGDYLNTLRIRSDEPIEVSYYGESVRVSEMSGYEIGIPFGRVILTQIGKELYPICGSSPVDGFFSRICRYEWLGFIRNFDEAKAKEIERTYKETWREETLR